MDQPEDRLGVWLAKQLHEARADKGLLREEMAERCGVTITTYKRAEAGDMHTTLQTLARFAKALHRHPITLLIDYDRRKAEIEVNKAERAERVRVLEKENQKLWQENERLVGEVMRLRGELGERNAAL